MGKNRVKCGPGLIYQDNPDWGKELAENTPSELKQQQYLSQTDEDGIPPPPARLVDLHHLSLQPFAQSIKTLKRWFFNAFTLEEDQYLFQLPDDVQKIEDIKQRISYINNCLNQEADTIYQADLANLKAQICLLFETPQWLGVALQMVDGDAFSIDALNTLMLWQASIIQFGKTSFNINKVSSDNPLKSRAINYTTTSITKPCLHQVIFADITLTLEDIRATAWGKIKEQEIRKIRPQITIQNFSNGLVYFNRADQAQGVWYAHFPSTLLLERFLIDHRCWSIPLFGCGYLPYEAFIVAAFFGARPMQVYLPEGKGNRIRAHGEYLGPALVSGHDFFHAALSSDDDKQKAFKKLRISSILGNALVQIDDFRAANIVADRQFGISQDGYACIGTVADDCEKIAFLIAAYTELALAAGLGTSLQSVQCEESAKDYFQINILFDKESIDFFSTLWGQTPFYIQFEQILQLRNILTSPILPQFIDSTQNNNPGAANTHTEIINTDKFGVRLNI